MLDIGKDYPCFQFQGKRMIQTQENGKKPNFGPDLGPLGPNLSCQNFFTKLVARYCSKLLSYEPHLRK